MKKLTSFFFKLNIEIFLNFLHLETCIYNIIVIHKILFLLSDLSSQVRIHPDPGSPPLPGGPPDNDLRGSIPQGLLIKENGIYVPLNQQFTAAISEGGWIFGKIQSQTIHPIYNQNLKIVKVNPRNLSVREMNQREILSTQIIRYERINVM